VRQSRRTFLRLINGSLYPPITIVKRKIKFVKLLTLQITAPTTLKEFVHIIPTNITYSGEKTLILFNVIDHATKEFENITTIHVEVVLQRMFLFHLTNTYIPTLCLIYLVEMTLFIDDSHFDTNVMLSLTTLLVMYTLYQSTSNSLPQTGYLKFLDIWLIFSLIVPFIIICIHVHKEINRTPVRKFEETKGIRYFIKSLIPNWILKCNSKLINYFVVSLTVVFISIYWMYAVYLYNWY